MREIKRLLLASFAAVLFMTPITAFAYADNVAVVDDADLLTDEEEKELAEYLESLDSDINYIAITSDTYEHGNNEDEISNYYYRTNFDVDADGIAFIIDMSDRVIDLAGYGEIQYDIKASDAYDITDNAYSYASRGEYYKCMKIAFEQADTLVNNGRIPRTMRYIVSFLVAIILGFSLAFVWAVSDRSKKALVSSSAEILALGAAIAGTAKVIDTKREKIPRFDDFSSSGSSGGYSGGHSSHHSSFGGGFSGGHSSGHSFGGGGHSFGGGHSGGGHSHGGHSF